MKILFVVSGYYGHVNPTYSLVSALVKAGHTICYYGLESHFRNSIEQIGASLLELPEFLTIEQQDEKKIEETELTEETSLIAQDNASYTSSYVASCNKYFESDIKEFEYFFELTKDAHYDLVIGDKLHAYGIILAKTLNIPFIQSDYHIFFTHKEEHEIVRLQNLQSQYKQEINTECLEKFNHYLQTGLENAVLPNVKNIDEYIEFYINPRHWVIVYSPQHLFNYNKSAYLPKNLLFLGNRFDLQNFNNASEYIPEPKSFYISFGTAMNLRSNLLVKIIEEIQNFPITAIVSVGGAKQVYEELKHLGNKNLEISLFVNQPDILQKVDLFITHAGANSIYEALYYAVPMILIPHGGDQIENSRIVTQLGAGRMVENYNDGFSKSLNLAIKDMQENYSFYKGNAKKVANWCKSSLNGEEIVSQIEYLISTKYESFLIPQFAEDKCLMGDNSYHNSIGFEPSYHNPLM